MPLFQYTAQARRGTAAARTEAIELTADCRELQNNRGDSQCLFSSVYFTLLKKKYGGSQIASQ